VRLRHASIRARVEDDDRVGVLAKVILPDTKDAGGQVVKVVHHLLVPVRDQIDHTSFAAAVGAPTIAESIQLGFFTFASAERMERLRVNRSDAATQHTQNEREPSHRRTSTACTPSRR
jgi:hypothetical protein